VFSERRSTTSSPGFTAARADGDGTPVEVPSFSTGASGVEKSPVTGFGSSATAGDSIIGLDAFGAAAAAEADDAAAWGNDTIDAAISAAHTTSVETIRPPERRPQAGEATSLRGMARHSSSTRTVHVMAQQGHFADAK